MVELKEAIAREIDRYIYWSEFWGGVALAGLELGQPTRAGNAARESYHNAMRANRLIAWLRRNGATYQRQSYTPTFEERVF